MKIFSLALVLGTMISMNFASAGTNPQVSQHGLYDIAFGSINLDMFETSLSNEYRAPVVITDISRVFGGLLAIDRANARVTPVHQYKVTYDISLNIAGAHNASCILTIYGRDGGRASVTNCRSKTAQVRDVEVSFEAIGLAPLTRAPSF